MNNICYFVHTCDNYQEFWNGWHVSYTKFWPKDINWKVYFVTEEKINEWNDSTITNIETFKTKKEWIKETREFDTQGNKLPTTGSMKQFDYGWSDRLIHALNQIEEEYILYVQEDMWLKHSVDKNILENAYRFVERKNINALRIHRLYRVSSGKENFDVSDYYIGNERLLKVNKNAGYLMNHQPTIWKKSFLLDILIPGESFRDNEFEGTERIRAYDDPKIYHLNYDWCYGLPGAAAAGKFHSMSFFEEWQENVNDVCVKNDMKLTRENFVPECKGLKLSLVTSCFNSSNYLYELYNSIKEQSYDNWEWILADDFSTDDTLDVILDLQSKDFRIKVVYPKYKKEIWWNPQIHATGDVVCHVDSDDKLLPKSLEMINYYFITFPDANLLHFNANKYFDELPRSEHNVFDNFKDNVYISKDNDSFLDAFSRLYPGRTNIFGYLRIFRNIPNLFFNVYEDNDECSSNDGQWLLMMEEKGKWLTIPRTLYLARDHSQSENHRNWNIRGEVKLIQDAKARRKTLVLDKVRNIKYFDEIYEAAESTYSSRLNFEVDEKTLSFINYDYTISQKERLIRLFPDHKVNFDFISSNVDYYFLIFQSFHKVEDIVKIIDDITQQCKTYKELCVFVPNLHQQHNNRTGKRYIEDLFSQLSSRIAYYWKEQDNRLFLSSYNPVSHISETDESKNHEENNNVLNPILDFQSDDTLKILHILVGCGIDVPPRGYGGTEEVIYHYKRVAESRGHEVELKHIDEITYEDMKYYDVIHNHIGGFHEILEQRNMPYVYTMHDSWAKIHGKGSFGHNINNKVIKNSLFTLVPAKNLVDYFDYSDKTFHLDHGVDTNFYFKYRDKPEEQKRLICVGGNDERKGFHLAILAARELNMPITIIGPDSVHADYNEKFYNIVKECRKHIDVVVTGNVDKTVLRNYINTGHIVIHPAIEETGQPCLGVLEAMACGLPAISTMQDNVDIPGMVQIKRNVEDIIDSVKIILNDYDNFSKKAREFAESRDWNIIFDSLEKHYYRAKELKRKYPLDMKERLIHNYEFSEKTDSKFDTKFNITYKPNPHINITGTSGRKFDVEFIDNKTGYCHYRTTLSENTWAASNISYYVDWKVIVRDNATQDILFVDRHMFIGKKVHIVFDSAALGDNIAWMGVVDAFNKKHNCKVSASTFFNDIFKEQYSDIEFVEPNTYFSNFDYTYKLGFFEKSHLSPNDCKNVSLQQLAAGILGLHEFVETIPKITVKEKETEIKNPYVVIATQSTAQAKYWNNPGSWEKIVDFLKEKNYDVVCVDKHKIYGSGEYMNTSPVNTIPRHERTLDQTIATINEAEFFIGLGSGLSWLAWALNKHVVLISGFSNPMSEFSTNCTRIFNDKGCNSCYNRHKFDPGDWLWCPDQKGTDRMFECTKNITPEEVIQAIENIIEMRNNE